MSNPEAINEHADVQASDIARFVRVFSVGAVEVTPVNTLDLRDTISFGNYAQSLAEDEVLPEDELEVSAAIAARDETIDGVVAGLLPDLVPRVTNRWQSIGIEQRQRGSGLLNTLYQARDELRDELLQFTGREDDDAFERAADHAVDNIEDWLTSPGRYVVRPQRIKPTILSEDEQQAAFKAMQDLPPESDEWKQERAKLLESMYRVGKFIAVERFLKPGRLPRVLDADDLAQEAMEYVAVRLRSYSPDKDIPLVSWCLPRMYADSHYTRVKSVLADTISIPADQRGLLYSSNIPRRLGVAAMLLSEDTREYGLVQAAWFASGRHIVSLDDEDAMVHYTSQISPDQGGTDEIIPWQDLLTDYHRVVGAPQGRGGGTNVWAGHGATDGLVDPERRAEMGLVQTEVQKVLEEVLDEREGMIVGLRFGIEDGITRTLQEVGEHFGLTRERTRQIEARALSKMRYGEYRYRLEPFMLGGPEGHMWSLENYVRRPVADALPAYDIRDGITDIEQARRIYEAGRNVPRRRRASGRRPVQPSEWDW